MKRLQTMTMPLISTLCLVAALAAAQPVDPLPSWNDTASKKSIQAFVERVTRPGSQDFVPPAERIAVFDNDGTLWSEQPMYFQLLFILDRVRVLAPQHPAWQTTQPFKAVLENDMQTVFAAGEHGLLELAMATHAGTTTEEFARIARDWLATAKHPRFQRRYDELVYQQMNELKD